MKNRLEILRKLLSEGSLSTQDELRVKLEKQRFSVTQSTISRDLRKLGAVRAVDEQGRTVYRLPDLLTAEAVASMEIVRDVRSNGAMVVVRTAPGAASMVARHLDLQNPEEILGTIAGDDTIFIAMAERGSPQQGVKLIRDLLKGLE